MTIELSEKRQKINELLGKDELSTEERSELDAATKRIQECEVEIRAALVVENVTETRTDPGEAAELRALVSRASLGNIFDSVIEHRSTSGPELEIQQHFKLAGNQVPLILLRSGPETRAVTPAPGDVGQNQAPIIPGVFPQACASWLGVGEAVYPVLTTNATVHTPAEGADADETTGAFSASVLSPSRLQASFFFSREDRARFAGMSEALRQNLSDTLADALDKEILAGSNGLLHSTNLANNNASAVTTFAGYVSDFGYSRVDGKYASMTSDLKIVMGSGTFAHAGGTCRSNNADYNAIDALTRIMGGIKVSAHVPSASGNKQNAIVRLGSRRDAVSPVWQGISLIPDEIMKAKSGEIVITAVMLHAVKILRAGGFHKRQAQHA